jgi:predicted helicase
MSFQKILDKYRKISFSEKDKGERFERLMKAYLLTDPKYAYKFKKVWLRSEFPGKQDLGGGDIGIDLVALNNKYDIWAFSDLGRKLIELYLNYETVTPYPEVKVTGDHSHNCVVQ